MATDRKPRPTLSLPGEGGTRPARGAGVQDSAGASRNKPYARQRAAEENRAPGASAKRFGAPAGKPPGKRYGGGPRPGGAEAAGPRKRYGADEGAGPRKRYGADEGAGARKRYGADEGAGPRKRYGADTGAAPRKPYGTEASAGGRKGYAPEAGAGPRKRYGADVAAEPRKRYGPDAVFGAKRYGGVSDSGPRGRYPAGDAQAPRKRYGADDTSAPRKRYGTDATGAPRRRYGGDDRAADRKRPGAEGASAEPRKARGAPQEYESRRLREADARGGPGAARYPVDTGASGAVDADWNTADQEWSPAETGATALPADRAAPIAGGSRDDEARLRAAIVATARRMNALGINRGKSGNVSARFGDGFLITPSGLDYERMAPADVVRMGPEGVHEGALQPSSEWRFHRDILAARPEVGAIVHAHAPFATTLACLRRGLPAFHYMVAVAGGSDIRCGRYATFGSQALSDNALAALEGRTACLLANHGLIAMGADLDAALALAVEVEALCAQYWRALQIGEPVLLSADEMAAVVEKFRSYGQPLPAAASS